MGSEMCIRDSYSPEFELTVAKFTKSYVCSMLLLLLLFFSDFLHQFHEMLIRCIHLFSLCIKYWSLRRQFPPYRVKEVKIASLNFYLRVQFSLVELGSDACNYFSRKAIGVLMIYLSYY